MRSTRRSPCPVACALDLIGDRWTLLIVRDLACGKSLFKEFGESPEKISTNILADRLERLVEHGLVERIETAQSAGRVGYRLTAEGKSLLPVLGAMATWGLAHLPGTEARMKIIEC